MSYGGDTGCVRTATIHTETRSTQRREDRSWANDFRLCVLRLGGVISGFSRLFFLCILCLCSCAGIFARGRIGGQSVETRVDSEIARYFIASYLSREPRVAALDARIDILYRSGSGGALPDRSELKRLSDEFSSDFAALYFADRIASIPRNRDLRAAYDRARSLAQSDLRQAGARLRSAASEYDIVFVPGYLYKRHRNTGADLAAQRAALQKAGLDPGFVETVEDGAIEANAEIVAGAIRARGRSRRIILASVSKASPEVALALTRLGPEGAAAVAAWINIAGTLQGSPLADGRLVEWEDLIGQVDPAGVESLSTAGSRRRFANFQVPGHVFVLNYFGIPLSAGISWLGRSGYSELRAHGPNDGVSLLADLVYPHAATLVEVGQDHFLLDEQSEAAAIGLALTVLQHIESSRAEPGPEAARTETPLETAR